MKKIQVDPESWRSVEQFEDNRTFEELEVENKFKDKHTFKEFEDENEFKANHAFEEFKDKSEFNDDHAFEEFEGENEFDQVRKLGLIFIHYKSEVPGQSGPEICLPDLQLQEVSGRSGLEIGTDLHLLQVRGRRPIRSGNWDWSSPTTSLRSQADRVWKFGQTNSQKRLLGFPSYTKPSLKIKW